MLDSWNDSYYLKKWGISFNSEKCKLQRDSFLQQLLCTGHYQCVWPQTGERIFQKKFLYRHLSSIRLMVLEAMISEIPGNLLSSEGEYMFYLRYLTPDGEKRHCHQVSTCRPTID